MASVSSVTDHEPTFKRILVPVDNSPRSETAIDAAAAIAAKFDAEVVGIHVYAARLHDRRFTEMESGLPEKYQRPEELKRQRDIHGSLITEGLEIISDSYLDVAARRCSEHGVRFSGERVEGKNYAELARIIRQQQYDLVVMGATGLGDAERDAVGSVCLRVIRRIETDCLVVKDGSEIAPRIVAAVDGSLQSFAGVKTALMLARGLRATVEAVAAFDPDFHATAFRGLKGVLSDEAGEVFHVNEQEHLHEQIIDSGMAKIYRGHLETAQAIADDEGVEIKTTLVAGKPYRAILEHLHRCAATLLVVGRVGIHADAELDVGSNTENLLRLAPCNILISAGPPSSGV